MTAQAHPPSVDFAWLPEDRFRAFLRLVHTARGIGVHLSRPLAGETCFRLSERRRLVLASADLGEIEQALERLRLAA